MKIYSATLTREDLHCASVGLALFCSDIGELVRPRLRPRGFHVTTRGYERGCYYGLGRTRRKNTGSRGASALPAASWDAHGHWMAALFDRDPLALIVAGARYDGRMDFHRQTRGRYAPTPWRHLHEFRDPGLIAECGGCESYHRESFAGDCRDDDERFPTFEVRVCTCGAWCADDGGEPEIHEPRNARDTGIAVIL